MRQFKLYTSYFNVKDYLSRTHDPRTAKITLGGTSFYTPGTGFSYDYTNPTAWSPWINLSGFSSTAYNVNASGGTIVYNGHVAITYDGDVTFTGP